MVFRFVLALMMFLIDFLLTAVLQVGEWCRWLAGSGWCVLESVGLWLIRAVRWHVFSPRRQMLPPWISFGNRRSFDAVLID